MVKYSCHDLYLGSKALYVMGSLSEQAARIHGLATWNKLSQVFFSARVSPRSATALISVGEELVESSGSDPPEEIPTPGPSRPDCRSHGCAGCSPDALVSSVLIRHRWEIRSAAAAAAVVAVQFPHGSEESDGKPNLDGIRVCRRHGELNIRVFW